MNPIRPTGETLAAVPSTFALVPIGDLKEHEEVVSDGTVAALAERIAKDGFVLTPIVVDRVTKVVLDGHHRLHALRTLGVRLAPVNLVDYSDPRIRVASWRPGEEPPSKEDVLARALAGRPYPPKSTRHEALYGLPDRTVPLEDLR